MALTMIIWGLLLMLIAVGRIALTKHWELQALKASKSKLEGEEGEDILAYLEASAVVSPTAQRALESIKKASDRIVDTAEAKGLLVPRTSTTQWQLMMDDIKREPDDEHRVPALQAWVDAGCTMTPEERIAIINLFGVDGRQTARTLLLSKTKQAPTAKSELVQMSTKHSRTKKS